MIARRPNPTEYDARFERYMKLVPEVDICAALAQQLQVTSEMVRRIPSSRVAIIHAR